MRERIAWVTAGVLLVGGCGGAGGSGLAGDAGAAAAPADERAGGTSGAASWKVVQWNVKKGYGKAGWTGACAFRVGSDCSRNAWGSGILKQTLVDQVGKDPAVIALALNEAQYCATPRRVQELLGWAAVAPATATGEAGGIGIVARYGLADSPAVKPLARCPGSPYQRYVVHAPVYADPARTAVVDIFATHWSGCTDEAEATIALMQRAAGRPRVLLGDLNAKPDTAPIARLAGRDYADAWARLEGSSGSRGYTSTYNNAGGSPRGSLYKRIDYAFSKNLTPVSVTRFNHRGTAGACAQSDHAGLVAEYAD